MPAAPGWYGCRCGDLTPTIPSDSTIAAAWPLTTELCRGEPPFALPPVFAPADPVGDRVAHAFGQSRHRFAAHRLSRAGRGDGRAPARGGGHGVPGLERRAVRGARTGAARR